MPRKRGSGRGRPPSEPTDEEVVRRERDLVSACINRSSAALDTLVRQYGEQILEGATKALLARQAREISAEAEDLAQEFVADLIQEPKSILSGFDPDDGRLGPWLVGVAFNRCSNILRHRKFLWPSKGRNVGPWMVIDAVARESLDSHPVDVVEPLLNRLPVHDRRFVQARFGLGPYFRPLTIREIAEEMHCSPDHVKRHLHLLLEHMRAMGSAQAES